MGNGRTANAIQQKSKVFVGHKGTAEYAYSIKTAADTNQVVQVLARGTKISKACDASFLALRKFLNGWSMKSTVIYTEEITSINVSDNNVDYVSCIQITLEKKPL